MIHTEGTDSNRPIGTHTRRATKTRSISHSENLTPPWGYDRSHCNQRV